MFVGFEVITGVTMESTVFSDVTPCSLLELSDVSEEHTASIIGVGRISETNIRREESSEQSAPGFRRNVVPPSSELKNKASKY
jgi:hypothetical protein